MKHTFVLIDKLMELLAKVPPKLNNEDDVGKAKETLDKIIEYNWKLSKLIDAHRTTEHLNKLHACHVDNIPNWAERVNAQFRKLDALMKVLHEDIPRLQEILKQGYTKQNEINSNAWSNKVGDMSMGMLMAGFHHAEQDMEEFRKAEVFEKKHLLELLKDLSAIEDLLE